MITPKLYGNETFKDLLRYRKTCGTYIIGLTAYRYMCGLDTDEHAQVQKQVDKLKKIIYTVCVKMAHGDEQKGFHRYMVFMKRIDQKVDAIDDIVYAGCKCL